MCNVEDNYCYSPVKRTTIDQPEKSSTVFGIGYAAQKLEVAMFLFSKFKRNGSGKFGVLAKLVPCERPF